MRRLVLLPLVFALSMVTSAVVAAQSLTESAVTAAMQAATQKPAPTPAPAPEPAQSTPAPAEESSRSLFEPTWHQFMFGGRITSVDGDPARFQRYQDKRDGVYFSDAKYEALGPSASWLF